MGPDRGMVEAETDVNGGRKRSQGGVREGSDEKKRGGGGRQISISI